MLDLDHTENSCRIHLDAAHRFESAHSEAAAHSARIIRWLPLLAANDFLEEDVDLPPVA